MADDQFAGTRRRVFLRSETSELHLASIKTSSALQITKYFEIVSTILRLRVGVCVTERGRFKYHLLDIDRFKKKVPRLHIVFKLQHSSFAVGVQSDLYSIESLSAGVYIFFKAEIVHSRMLSIHFHFSPQRTTSDEYSTSTLDVIAGETGSEKERERERDVELGEGGSTRRP